MKKAVAFFLAVVMMISLAACERSDTGKKQSSNEIIADNPGNSDVKEGLMMQNPLYLMER